MLWAEIIVYSTFIYLSLGFLFALWFAAFGITKLDDAAKGTGFGFRLIIFGGAIPFWILLAWRLLKGQKSPTEQNAHRRKSMEVKS
jgi:hypothetical protein